MKLMSLGELGPGSTLRCKGKPGVVLMGTVEEIRVCAPLFSADVTVVDQTHFAKLVEFARIAADAPRGHEHVLPLAAQAILSELGITRESPRAGHDTEKGGTQ